MIYAYESQTQSWEYRWRLIKFWLPPLATGLLTLLILLLSQTPPIRATGLALVIVGLTASLRRMGSLIAVVGGLMLTFSPAFWSQSGGTQGSDLTIVIALLAATTGLLVLLLLSRQFYVSLAIGLIIFVVIFFSQVATPRSLRLTALVIGWLVYLLNDMLLLTNPRPDEAPLLLLDKRDKHNEDDPTRARPQHTWGILLLFAVGCLNDPIMVLLAPCLLLAIYLTQTRLPILYWVLFGITIGIGLYGFREIYLIDLERFMRLTEWRDAAPWVDMLAIMSNQFTTIGLFLGALGLARLTRWYPPIGTVTLVGYAAFWLFGVVYIGPDRSLLLLPLFAIHVFWMSYSVLALATWVERATAQPAARLLVLLAYALVPFSLAWQAFFA